MASIFSRHSKDTISERSFFPEEMVSASAPVLFSADKNPTVATCVDKISKTFASITPILYVHTKTGNKKAYQENLFRLLEHPCYEETTALFWGTLYRHLIYKGNAYVHLGRSSNGEIVNFSLCAPNMVRVSRDSNYRKVFTIGDKVYTDKEILHIPYPGDGYNGTVGVSPIEVHRGLIELDNLLLTYIENYFDNSVGSRLMIELGQSYGSKSQDLNKVYASVIPVLNKFVVGAKNAGKPMVGIPDSKISKIDQSSNVQAELKSLLDMVEHQIAMTVFGIPYECIDSSASKYNSLEAKQNDYLASCIKPLGDHICQSFERLVDKPKQYIEYDYKQLLTTDTSTTIDVLNKEVMVGALSVNEYRRKIGMDDIGEAGDVYFFPANMMPLRMDVIEAYMADKKAQQTPSEGTEEN